MPLYGTSHICITPGDFAPATLWNAEQPTTGQASIGVAVELQSRELKGLAFEFVFASNPGTFNFQVQGADTDVAAAYETEGSGTITTATSQADGTFRARVELSPWVAQFTRVLIQTQTSNAVNATVTVRAF